MLERALANMPVLMSTSEGGPPTDIEPHLCKLRGGPSPDDAEYLQQQCQDIWEHDGQSDSSEQWFDSRIDWLDPQDEEDFDCYMAYD